MPRAAAEIRLPGGALLAGRGYVERLTLTIAPWELPIEELRWGRFHGPEETVVWIDWRGTAPRCWVFWNGSAVPDGDIGEGGLRFAGGELSIEEGSVLRGGPLVSAALAGWPLRWLLPRRVLALQETKRFGPAALRRPGTAPIAGTALHEVVRWP